MWLLAKARCAFLVLVYKTKNMTDHMREIHGYSLSEYRLEENERTIPGGSQQFQKTSSRNMTRQPRYKTVDLS